MHFNILNFSSPNAGSCRVSRSPDHPFCPADPGVHQSDILAPSQPSAVSTRSSVSSTSDSATVTPSVHRSQALNHETAHEPDCHVSHHCGQHAIEHWGPADQLPGHNPGGLGILHPGEPFCADPAAAAPAAAAADAAAADAADAAAAAPAAPDASADPAADAAAAFSAPHATAPAAAAAAAAAAQPTAAAAAAPTAAPAAAAAAHAAPVSAFASAALARRLSDDVPRPRHREPPAGLPAAPVTNTVADTDSSVTAGQYFLKMHVAGGWGRGGEWRVNPLQLRLIGRCWLRRNAEQITWSSEVSIR